jgi:hypothetical protein
LSAFSEKTNNYMMLCANGQANGATEAAVNTIGAKEQRIRSERKHTSSRTTKNYEEADNLQLW